MEKLRNAMDITNGIENVPVPVEDPKVLWKLADFVYVRCNIPGPTYKRQNFEDQYDGCVCPDSEGCKAECCSCLKRFDCHYTQDGLLLGFDPLSDHMAPIVECNKLCKCSSSCRNRLVQRGLQAKLEVFSTRSDRGYGVRCLEALRRNAFVCEYAGEILTPAVSRQRSAALTEQDSNYILVLQEHLNSGQVVKCYIDPTYIGNVGRFINHSCRPNLFMVPVRVNNSVPHAALFSLRDIEVGEELSFDYSGQIDSGQGTLVRPLQGAAGGERPSLRKDCLCGADNCRGVLPLDESLYTDENGQQA